MIETLMQKLNKGPYITKWIDEHFSPEYVTITKIDDLVEIKLELDYCDEYYDDISSYKKIIKLDDLVKFMEMRLVKIKKSIAEGYLPKDHEIELDDILESFCELIKSEIDEKERTKQLELFNSKIPELRKIAPNYLELPEDTPEEERNRVYQLHAFIRDMPEFITPAELKYAVTDYFHENYDETAYVDEIKKVFHIEK